MRCATYAKIIKRRLNLECHAQHAPSYRCGLIAFVLELKDEVDIHATMIISEYPPRGECDPSALNRGQSALLTYRDLISFIQLRYSSSRYTPVRKEGVNYESNTANSFYSDILNCLTETNWTLFVLSTFATFTNSISLRIVEISRISGPSLFPRRSKNDKYWVV